MCKSPTTRDEHDRPAYPQSAFKAEPHWPHFLAADNGHCFADGKPFHVRLPGPRAADRWAGVTWAEAHDASLAYAGCPIEVGAFVAAAERHAEGSAEMRQFGQLIRLLEMAAEVAMDMLAGHGRLCGCPLCFLFAALDDREPGYRAGVWARIAEMPAVLVPAALYLKWNVAAADVPTAEAIRLTGEDFQYGTLASALAYPPEQRRTASLPAASPI